MVMKSFLFAIVAVLLSLNVFGQTLRVDGDPFASGSICTGCSTDNNGKRLSRIVITSNMSIDELDVKGAIIVSKNEDIKFGRKIIDFMPNKGQKITFYAPKCQPLEVMIPESVSGGAEYKMYVLCDDNSSSAADNAIRQKADELYSAQKYSEASVCYELLTNKEDKVMQFRLGWCYESLKNYEKAVEWYQKAAAQGLSSAQCNLGFCYESGRGVTQNYDKAVELYQKAAEQGNSNAQCNLGFCYEKGRGVTQNYEKAVEWYQRAAAQGLSRAQLNLGFCYEKGRGITQNYEKAVEWYQKAAAQGNSIAQCNLGLCYKYGKGVEINIGKAKEWLQKSADQGYGNAINELNGM